MICRDTRISAALKARQRGFLLNPFRFGGGGGGPPSGSTTTWSPTDKTTNWTTSGGDLIATGNGSGSAESIRATAGSAASKIYWEVEFGAIPSPGQSLYIGVALGPADQAITAIGSPFWLLAANGTVFSAGGSGSGGGGAVAVASYLMFAYDPATGELWVGYNGSWRNSGNPAAGTGEVFTFSSLDNYFPLLQLDGSAGSGYQVTLNCGATSFNSAPPSGFAAL